VCSIQYGMYVRKMLLTVRFVLWLLNLTILLLLCRVVESSRVESCRLVSSRLVSSRERVVHEIKDDTRY
jgi:hypothetical protein